MPRTSAALLLTLALVAGPLAADPTGAAPGAASGAASGAAPSDRRAGTARKISYVGFDTAKAFGTGHGRATEVRRDRVFLDGAGTTRSLGGTTYDVGRWVSPWVEPGFDLTELVASWEARTPGDSWVEIEVRGRADGGKRSSWDLLGRWASGDKFVRRTSVSGQSDDLASVSVDTWRTASATGLAAWQLRVSLMRRTGASTKPPSLGSVGAMASRLPAATPSTSKPGVVAKAGGAVLDVPRYSQMIHDGDYPKYGGGGEAWCSPTSTSMVLGYYDALPAAKDYAWVGKGHPDPWVDHAARMTFDDAYDGTGNWPFNTAYAARQTGSAFVTRLRGLREAEKLVAAGIPPVVSIAFSSGELDGAPISSSNGHLVVIVGFTAAGDVVVNDPAADSDAGVRRTYDRGQLERAWLHASGGLAYVIHDADHPLPAGKHSNF